MPKRVQKRTAKVVTKNGEVRLSPDLLLSDRFFAYTKGNVIELVPARNKSEGIKRVYFSNPRAKSGRISLGPEFRKLHIVPKQGTEYRARIKNGFVFLCIGG